MLLASVTIGSSGSKAESKRVWSCAYSRGFYGLRTMSVVPGSKCIRQLGLSL